MKEGKPQDQNISIILEDPQDTAATFNLFVQNNDVKKIGTPLHIAVLLRNHILCVKYFSKADLNTINIFGYTPLQIATILRYDEIVRLFSQDTPSYSTVILEGDVSKYAGLLQRYHIRQMKVTTEHIIYRNNVAKVDKCEISGHKLKFRTSQGSFKFKIGKEWQRVLSSSTKDRYKYFTHTIALVNMVSKSVLMSFFSSNSMCNYYIEIFVTHDNRNNMNAPVIDIPQEEELEMDTSDDDSWTSCEE